MPPIPLTDSQKERKRQLLKQKGMELAIRRGVRKLSVNDIAGAAGMAKGTFYLHFESKEEFLFTLLKDLHERLLRQVEAMVLEKGWAASREGLRKFILDLFRLPEFSFFVRNHGELEELFEGGMDDRMRSLKEFEGAAYDKILRAVGVDVDKIKAGVVLNCVHVIFAGAGGLEFSADEDAGEAVGVLVDGLVTYISGGLADPATR